MQQLNDILAVATSQIAEPYFRLPIDGGEARLFERNYCYELYHQMRRQWPSPCEYTINGEIDKRGHPLIRPMGDAQAIPDLLVHIPSEMAGNYAIIEVKTADTNAVGIAKDLHTLARFTMPDIHYERAILLIFGGIDVDFVTNIAAAAPAHHRIELWTHDQVGQPAALHPNVEVTNDDRRNQRFRNKANRLGTDPSARARAIKTARPIHGPVCCQPRLQGVAS